MSPRTTCPECDLDECVIDLGDLLYSPRVDYFRCTGCGCWWMVLKGADEPAKPVIRGHPESMLSRKVVS